MLETNLAHRLSSSCVCVCVCVQFCHDPTLFAYTHCLCILLSWACSSCLPSGPERAESEDGKAARGSLSEAAAFWGVWAGISCGRSLQVLDRAPSSSPLLSDMCVFMLAMFRPRGQFWSFRLSWISWRIRSHYKLTRKTLHSSRWANEVSHSSIGVANY